MKSKRSQTKYNERKNRVATNLSDQELFILKFKMDKLGISNVSDFLRLKALGDDAIPIVEFPEVNEEISEQLRSLHSNLNQLVRQAHVSSLDEDLTKELLRKIKVLSKATYEVRDLLRGVIPHQTVLAIAYEILSIKNLKVLIKLRAESGEKK